MSGSAERGAGSGQATATGRCAMARDGERGSAPEDVRSAVPVVGDAGFAGSSPPRNSKQADTRPGRPGHQGDPDPAARAISVLRRVLAGGAPAAAEFDTWFVRIRDRQDGGEPLTVMEHTALAYVVRSGLPGGSSGGRIPREADAVLAKSWFHLAGRPARVRGPTARLPRSVLRGAGREVRLFHMAAFQPRRPTAAWSLRSAGRDYVPELSDAAAAAGVALVAASGPGRAMLGSAALGYAVATVAEYGMHRWAGHEGGGPIKPFLKRLGRMGERASGFLEATRVGHFVVHHAKTSNRHYTAQFAPAPPGDRATIDAELDALGAVGRRIKESDYGMTLSRAGAAAGLLATLPVHVALIWALGLGLSSAAALVAPSLLYVAASQSLHPYLHKSRDEAMTRAGPLMRRLLGTRYAEWISRSHWIHHKGGGGNFNLVPGADLLFGDYRKPDLRMLFRMRADRILGADWSAPEGTRNEPYPDPGSPGSGVPRASEVWHRV